jgi:hypothetical protein
MNKLTKDTKLGKFNFEAMKAGAESSDPAIRKQAFTEYFERFNEFPSFLFNNEKGIDASLYATMQDLINDIDTSPEMRRGVDALLTRLPSKAPVLG